MANYGDLYNIRGWGDPYFSVNANGNVSVKINGYETTPEEEIEVLAAINAAIATKKVQFPIILRFPNVLKHRLDSLHTAFDNAVKYIRYKSKYQGVFPVKVNQNRAIIEDFVKFGYKYNYGLEAGSKPELLIAMSCLTKASPDAYLVCNGYKDRDYIALALTARTMKLNTIIVLEMEEELDIIIDLSKKLGIEPVIGVRAKLLTKIPGHFGSTAGKHGKFGLPAEKIYEVAKKLQAHDMLNCLKLLHFHIGSMIPTTSIVGSAVREAAGIYCNLVEMGAPMGTLDCGGGLGVDYDGTRSGDSDMSVAYGLEEYASTVVQAARLVCDSKGVQHPVLCTESGRAMVSHHSMIILEALSAVPEPSDEETSDQLLEKIEGLAGKPTVIHGNLQSAIGARSDGSWYSHATDLKKHGIEMYKLGKKLSKRVVADDDTIYNYHMNLSVFSLIPDFWGIKQLFPMMPVSRLNEKPTQKSTLIDLTCDSDGKVELFIGNVETLPLHPLDGNGGYYIAALLSGAYQEALSSRHNLFGGPSLVRVESSGNGFEITMADLGPKTAALIDSMMYNHVDNIYNVIEERATEYHVWTDAARQLVTNVLYTMPYLIEFK